jgi:uncharacterized protein
MNHIRFVWDSSKASLNRKKHGISFEEAQTVFYDENSIEYFDPDHSENEDRFIMLGFSFKLRMLVVCYCVRTGNTIRIISARKATRHEAGNYRRG